MAKLEGVKTVDMVGGEITKISYDGAEYVYTEGGVNRGDIGLRVALNTSWAKVGEYYPIISSKKYKDDVGDEPYFNECDFRFFRKISDNKSTPTLAEVSEKVDAIEKRVGALEGVPKRLAIGDYAVITGKGDRGVFRTHKFDIGEVVKVTRYDTEEDRVCAEYLDGSDFWWVYNGYLRKATDEEIAEATAPKFEEGDYVKTLARGQFNDVEKGEIVRIRGTNKVDKYSVYAETTEGDTDFFRPQDLEKPEGKDAERAVQFAKAGRKLNEFKKGDIVFADWTRRSESGGLFEIENGPIGTGSGGNYEFKDGDVTLGKHLTLIAPVESRVDV